ncbi:hypothetical protein J1N35_044920 [Gossypium stocksii]|uniref:Transcription factor CBF/NF-Y/archaeal histone domain-containing protein n=1 Tax=Gossypium stocksii TaxID=47602 RepID=A0A9D3UAG3_9ROSI|nr:hypothetical protein J1N35_044920 [Gossypium stocksii]
MSDSDESFDEAAQFKMPSVSSKTEVKTAMEAHIKKIMQADEDVEKIALVVPVLVSKALELFVQDLCDHTYEIAIQRGAKTMNSLHFRRVGRGCGHEHEHERDGPIGKKLSAEGLDADLNKYHLEATRIKYEIFLVPLVLVF